MKLIKESKIEESVKSLSELRQMAWDVANGMSVVDTFKNTVDELIMSLHGYFEAVEKGDTKKAENFYNLFIVKKMDFLSKELLK